MGKKLDWVTEEANGRLIYRRVFPERLRPYLSKPGQRELKVALGAYFQMSDASWRAYSSAKRQFDVEVERAQAVYQKHEKQAAGVVDRLTPELIEYLVADWVADVLSLDDEVRWIPRSRERKLSARQNIRADISESLAEAVELRALGDVEGVVATWGETARDHAGHLGVLIDHADPELPTYLRAFNDGAIGAYQTILQRLDGKEIPTPAAPPRSLPAAHPHAGKERTVSALLKAYGKAKWDGWSQSSRSAVAPVFRLLEDVFGDRDVSSITREDARHLVGLLQNLPAGLGRRKELEGLSVLAAIEKGRQLGLPAISPGTVNRGYVAHISAVFGWAAAEEWTSKNQFKGLTVHDPVAEEDKRDPFSTDQLAALFARPPWMSPMPLDAAKPARYWVALVALFMGMRLGEAAGLRLMDVEEHEGIPSFNLRPYDGRTLKNRESRRVLPIHPELLRLGLLQFVAARRTQSATDDLLFPDAKANVRGQWGAKLGEWFVAHLKAQGIVGTKLGYHSFRHNFEDRLRAAKLHGTAIGLRLAGRKVPGSAGAYGDGFTMPDLLAAISRVSYPSLNLEHLTATNEDEARPAGSAAE